MRLLDRFRTKPQTLMMETKTMSAEILKPPVNRAVEAYRKLQDAHASAVAKILEQDAKIAADAVILAELKGILDAVFPEEVEGSMGGH